MNVLLVEMNQMAATGLAALLNTLWYAAVVVAMTWMALRFMRWVNAATRYWIWTVVLGFLIVLPFLPALVSLLEAAADGPAIVAPLATVPAAPQVVQNLAPVTIALDSTPGSNHWPLYLLALWIVISGWQLFLLLRGVISVKRTKCHAKAGPAVGLPVQPLRKLEVLASDEINSPVALGYIHPAVILPTGLLASLDEGEIQDVLLHELAHLARYDDWLNLASRMLGAILVLHPLAAIVLRQIEREREMACDDFVVAHTGSARNYARSLARLHDLRTVGGTRLLAPALLGRKISLADRIESLLHGGRKFSARPSLVNLSVGAFLLVVLLGVGGLIPDWIAVAQTKMSMTGPLCTDLPKWFCSNLPNEFEVASIKPAKPDGGRPDFMAAPNGRYHGTNLSAMDLIAFAYGFGPHQIDGLPSWAKSQKYTIEAEAPPGLAIDFHSIGKLPPNQRHQALVECEHRWSVMLRALLADRFKLKVHSTTKQLPEYELVVAKGGAKLKPPNAADFPGEGNYYSLGSQWFTDDASRGTRQMNGYGIYVSDIAGFLRGQTGRIVIDKTDLSGRYDVKLIWTPSPGADSAADFGDSGHGRTPADVGFSNHPISIVSAIQQQLGLKLKPAKGPVQVLVVDHIEPPTPN